MPGPTRQGVKPRVKPAGVDPRLVAGDASNGGGRRKRCSGHGLMRGWVLQVAGDVAHPTVAVFGAGVAGVNGGELFCGRRSSGLGGARVRGARGLAEGLCGLLGQLGAR